jgi:hypothetical protein
VHQIFSVHCWCAICKLLLGLYLKNGGSVDTWENDDVTLNEQIASALHDDDLGHTIATDALDTAELKLLKLKYVRSKLGTTYFFESISADANVLFDWLFITQTLQDELEKLVVGTVRWFLLTLDNADQSSSSAGSIFGHLLGLPYR